MIPDLAVWILVGATVVLVLPIVLELLIWFIFGAVMAILWVYDRVTA